MSDRSNLKEIIEAKATFWHAQEHLTFVRMSLRITERTVRLAWEQWRDAVLDTTPLDADKVYVDFAVTPEPPDVRP